MTLYKNWCSGTQKKTKKKTRRSDSEIRGSRAKVLSQLGETVKAHYDHTDRIVDDVASLSYARAEEILRTLLPHSWRRRPGRFACADCRQRRSR